MRQHNKKRHHAFRNLLSGMEQLEQRQLLAVVPPTGDLTEGNASAWEAFADGSTATVSNNTSLVREGTTSLKLDTQGGFDTGVRMRAPASNWDFSQIDVVTFWVYGENNTPFSWQGNQPVIDLISPAGSMRLEPNQQMMPNFSWAKLVIPLDGDSIWQRTTQGSFDIANVTTFEIHQDTWDFGFASYYDGLRFARFIDIPDLNQPKGVAVDSLSRTVVAEKAANQLRVFNSAGDGVQIIGSTGAGNGQLQSPSDVAIGVGNQIYVSDSGNNRVQIFNSNGTYAAKFGALGTVAGAFSNPTGLAFDSVTSKLYVADTGNHRVQRFLANGTLDTTWGVNGVVGTTGVVKRDHTGFDRPSDIAVNPVNGQVYISDLGNQRIEVYSSTGQYVRTYLAIYRPNALAFDSTGNLYIAGDDPNNSYTAYDGRLRVLRAGDELVSRHYTGATDDLGRQLQGVAVRPNGGIVFSDTLNRRLVQVDSTLTPPVSNVSVRTRGTSITVTWDTLVPGPSKILFNGTVYSNNLVTRTHAVTVNGTTPNTRAFYSIAFPDSFTGDERWTAEDVINTGAAPGETDFLRMKAVGIVYTDADTDAGYARLPQAEINAMRNRFDTVANYYWRNSGFKLWIDFTVREMDIDISSGVNLFDRMQPDLTSLGYSAADEIDAVYSVSPLAFGNFGGGAYVFDRFVAAAIWTTQSDFVAIHEVNHSIDSTYDRNNQRKYEFNHGIWAIPNGLGHDFSVNGQILRNMLSANFTATQAPFTKWIKATDADRDGVPDSSPAGLTKPLSITEATLGSSTLKTDTDGDGLTDLAEATLLVNSGSNVNVADSDGDGVRDSVDLNPLYKINNLVRRGTPTIDGSIGVGEGWTLVSDKWGFSNTSLVSDNNLMQSQISTYAAWDSNYLYFALQGVGGFSHLRIDGDADNWFMGPNNYQVFLRNDANQMSVNVNAGVPDVYRQIDDDGQFSEFFDTDPKFTQPYNGRPVFNQDGEGLGFADRLVEESDLGYQRGGTGSQRVWELRIPWSNETLLKGVAGKELAFDLNFEGDRLFETDHFARLRLVTTSAERPIVTLSGNVNYTENAAPVYLAVRGSVVDYDSFDLQNGQLTVTVATASSNDRLGIFDAGLQRGQIGVSGSNILFSGRTVGTFTGGTGTTPLVVTFNSAVTPAVAQALLRSITFVSTGDNPVAGARQVTFSLTDGDGGTSTLRTMTVTVNAVNDAPLLGPVSGGVLNYVQNGPSIAVLPGATLSDPDSSNFDGGLLSVAIAAGQNSSNRLTLSGSFSLSGNDVMFNGTKIGTRNVNGGFGTMKLDITLNSSATASIVQSLIRSIRFRTINGTSTLQRAVDFSLTDGDGGTSRTVRTLINVS